MGIKLGTKDIPTIFYGTKPIGFVFKGEDLIYQAVEPIPKYELLFDSNAEVTLPQTQINITGLSIGKNDELRLVYTFVGDSTSVNSNIACFPNDLTNAANYHSQFLFGSGSTISAVRVNGGFSLAEAKSNVKIAGIADIKVSQNDRYVLQTQYTRFIGSESSDLGNFNINTVGTQTVASITKLTVRSDRTNGIASGSRIRLYKVNTGEA
jgi:hypothetical protein